jgi:hypothetical protein
MEGGEISGNRATEGPGGGVEVWKGTFIMKNGAISNNIAQWSGGGVRVGENATFTKKGGIIYGDTDTTHAPDSTENTATNGHGHAVAAGDKKRNADADSEVKLYAKYESDTWTYNDTSNGGVGDTTANWED